MSVTCNQTALPSGIIFAIIQVLHICIKLMVCLNPYSLASSWLWVEFKCPAQHIAHFRADVQSSFSTNHLADTDRTKHIYKKEQHIHWQPAVDAKMTSMRNIQSAKPRTDNANFSLSC